MGKKKEQTTKWIRCGDGKWYSPKDLGPAWPLDAKGVPVRYVYRGMDTEGDVCPLDGGEPKFREDQQFDLENKSVDFWALVMKAVAFGSTRTGEFKDGSPFLHCTTDRQVAIKYACKGQTSPLICRVDILTMLSRNDLSTSEVIDLCSKSVKGALQNFMTPLNEEPYVNLFDEQISFFTGMASCDMEVILAWRGRLPAEHFQIVGQKEGNDFVLKDEKGLPRIQTFEEWIKRNHSPTAHQVSPTVPPRTSRLTGRQATRGAPDAAHRPLPQPITWLNGAAHRRTASVPEPVVEPRTTRAGPAHETGAEHHEQEPPPEPKETKAPQQHEGGASGEGDAIRDKAEDNKAVHEPPIAAKEADPPDNHEAHSQVDTARSSVDFGSQAWTTVPSMPQRDSARLESTLGDMREPVTVAADSGFQPTSNAPDVGFQSKQDEVAIIPRGADATMPGRCWQQEYILFLNKDHSDWQKRLTEQLGPVGAQVAQQMYQLVEDFYSRARRKQWDATHMPWCPTKHEVAELHKARRQLRGETNTPNKAAIDTMRQARRFLFEGVPIGQDPPSHWDGNDVVDLLKKLKNMLKRHADLRGPPWLSFPSSQDIRVKEGDKNTIRICIHEFLGLLPIIAGQEDHIRLALAEDLGLTQSGLAPICRRLTTNVPVTNEWQVKTVLERGKLIRVEPDHKGRRYSVFCRERDATQTERSFTEEDWAKWWLDLLQFKVLYSMPHYDIQYNTV